MAADATTRGCRCEPGKCDGGRGALLRCGHSTLKLAELADVIVAQPAWEGHSVAQELYDRRAAERRERRQVPEWFSVQDLVPEPWEREALAA
jgi:hypothetical protein